MLHSFDEYEADKWWDNLPNHVKAFFMIEYENILGLMSLSGIPELPRPYYPKHPSKPKKKSPITDEDIARLMLELTLNGLKNLKKSS